MNPHARYHQDVTSGSTLPDAEQALAIADFERLYQDLQARDFASRRLLWRIRSALGLAKLKHVNGLYLWGGVGAGKTYLMDLFYSCLPETGKMRTHFHEFMRGVHAQLTMLQGHAEPLQYWAKNLAREVRVICLDEFFVTDIGDAMILGRLLAALFQEGITLAVTSNLPPEGLYPNGLQRQSFLPTITLLVEQMQVFHLQAAQDYRLRNLTQAGVYFYPLNHVTDVKMRDIFARLSSHGPGDTRPLQIRGREIDVVRATNTILWVDFGVLCQIPRSQEDYLDIAHRFDTVLLSNVVPIAADNDNQITYLINLIDILYDTRVKLVISAAVPVDELYLQGRKLFEFERVKSRLVEMQSEEYLGLAHRV
jgi:cell division protein ZapE